MTERVDFLVLGSGPGGCKAAIQAAKGGRRVAVVESGLQPGGACVYQGTIPSKTLREAAVHLTRMKRWSGTGAMLPGDGRIEPLLDRLDSVLEGHASFIRDQLRRNRIELIHGRASFRSDRVVEVVSPDQSRRSVEGDVIVIATGSVPRHPSHVPVDHEHILDSDSILSLAYLPESLTVLGGGVIAAEYASIFSHLGTQVTMVDRYPLPLGFLDQDLARGFVERFEDAGGRWIGERQVKEVAWDGLSSVVTTLDDGSHLEGEKLLAAAGRVGALADLDLAAAGLETTAQGLLAVDEHARTRVPHIYAVGDVTGPPALAASAMEQGRRAAAHALGRGHLTALDEVPIGIYTIPELASVGLTEAAARELHGDVKIGRASFAEVARGLISGTSDGFLKLIADPSGERLLGAHVLGEGATELVHLGQLALAAEMGVERLVEIVFNFPTLAEAYRIAALGIYNQSR